MISSVFFLLLFACSTPSVLCGSEVTVNNALQLEIDLEVDPFVVSWTGGNVSEFSVEDSNEGYLFWTECFGLYDDVWDSLEQPKKACISSEIALESPNVITENIDIQSISAYDYDQSITDSFISNQEYRITVFTYVKDEEYSCWQKEEATLLFRAP